MRLFFGSLFPNLKQVLTRPSEFFQTNRARLHAPYGVAPALAFAVIVHWIGSLFNFFYRTLINVFFHDQIEDAFNVSTLMMDMGEEWQGAFVTVRDQVSHFLFGASMVLLQPFSTLVQLVSVSAVIHLAVWLWVSPGEDSRPKPKYSTTLKVICYSAAPWVFCLIPGVGTLIAYIAAFFIAVIGIRETYKVTTGRATWIVLFPEVLLFGGVMVGMFFVFLVGAYVLRIFL